MNNIKGLFVIKILCIIAALVGIVYCYLYDDWLMLLYSYLYYRVLTLVANGIGLHRYFSHKSFKTTKSKHIFLCWVSVLIGEADPALSALVHRHHHKHSDLQDDIHSPMDGFWHTIFLWTTKPKMWFLKRKVKWQTVADVMHDPYARFISNNYIKIWAGLLFVSWSINWQFAIFFVMMPVVWEIVMNSFFSRWFVHVKTPLSYRNYSTGDKSYNNPILLALNTAEVYHNNHHKYPGKYNQAMFINEFDPAGYIIKKFFEESTESKQYKW